jgi:3-phosphoshikimate 1-carboxyvinyltransferase
MEKLTLHPVLGLSGEVLLPGSKSLSNRALLLAALAEGTTVVQNLLDSDDVSHMKAALTKLGVTLRETPEGLAVEGCSGPLPEGHHDLFLGNAGTAMRPLAAALTLGWGKFELGGEPRMEERPIGDLVDALRQAGAIVHYLKNPGYPPLSIEARGLRGGRVRLKGNISSQYLTALLMAAPYAQEPLVIEIEGDLVSKPYVTITLDCMAKFGIEVENRAFREFRVPLGKYRSPGSFFVEGDASSASYFLAGAAISGQCKVIGAGKSSVQGDVRFAEVLEQMGAKVTWGDHWIAVESPRNADGSPARLQAVDVDLNHIPDAAMTIATTALFAQGTTAIRNVYNWRVKETDRLAAMAAELRKVGAQVVEGEDFIEVTPPEQIVHAEIETYNDHRMAMCFSLVALSGTPVTILDPKCTAKTFPDYFERFAQVTQGQA